MFAKSVKFDRIRVVMRKKQLLFSFIGIVFIISATVLLILYGRGWKVNPETRDLSKTGLLSASSWPSGASVFINGRLTTATNTPVQLDPGKYQVRIEKEGFIPWEKAVEIKPELVYETNARLFPAAPELKPLTSSGVLNPVLSPDGEKIVYGVASSSAQKNGIWTIDMKTNPLNLGGNQRQIIKDMPGFSFSNASLFWTPDSKSVLVTLTNGNFLLDATTTNDGAKLFDVTATLPALKAQWDEQEKTQKTTLINRLPIEISKTASASAMVKISYDETKALYKENLNVKGFKVYDIEKKKTYDIPDAKIIYWLPEPENTHLVLVNDQEISIIESEGTNRVVIFSGPFENGIAYPWSDGLRLVILTSFSRALGSANLYTISLR